MAYGVVLRAWGNRACFTRPEMKVERVSYDVPTPSAVRGILEAIYWKPAIRWVVDKIIVLNPISFENIRRNELGGKLAKNNITKAMKDGVSSVETFIEDDRQQRATMFLKNVDYVFYAHFELTGNETDISEDKNTQKHYEIFKRRAKKGQCFHQAYFGCREFPVNFEWFENSLPQSVHKGEEDLGWMLYDIDFQDKNDLKPLFFRAKMVNGIIAIPHYNSGEVVG